MKYSIVHSLIAAGLLALSHPALSHNHQSQQSNQAHLKQQAQKPVIGLQLWSVKDALQQDFVGTLSELAAMGFDGVEFAGYFGPYQENAAGLKQLLTQLNLQTSAAHVDAEAFAPEVINKNLLFYKTLGVDMLIIPWDERAWSASDVPAFANELTRLSAELAKYGMTVGFHNHQYEFASYKSKTFWDYIASNTPENVVLQLDVGWVFYANHNPIDYIKRYPGRTLTTHYKIHVKEGEKLSAIIGENHFDWPSIIKANLTVGGTKWIVLEQEQYPDGLSSMQSVAKTKAGFDRIYQAMQN
ncbi:sugar phosphate isomerase/epimerase family protein [Colwellia sp. MEBiC06753]